MRFVIVLLLALALVAALGLTGVLPIFGSGQEDADDTGYVPEEDLEGDRGARLAGIEGGATETPTEMEAEVEAPSVPSRVKGSTRNGAVVEGRVVHAKGKIPAAGAMVHLRRVDSLFHYLRAEVKGRFDVLVAQADAEGRFAFTDITPSDRYVVRAGAETGAWASSSPLDLRGAEHVELDDLELQTGGAFAGRVVDNEGKPIADARVVTGWAIQNSLGVVLSDPAAFPEIEREAMSDAQGRFRIEGLEPGQKTVVAAAPDGASRVLYRRSAEDGKTLELGDIRMSPDRILAGRVQWADGAPCKEAQVYAGLPNREMRSTTTDAEGRFEAHYLPEGKLAVGVLVPGLPVQVQFGIEAGREDLVFSLPKAGRLTGRVVLESDGAPVEDFKILVKQVDIADMQTRFVQDIMIKALGPTRFQDEQGRYGFDRLAAGWYDVTVQAEGYPSVTKHKVVVAEDGTLELDFELPAGNGLSGRVLHADGRPAAETRVYLFPQGGLPGTMSSLDLKEFLEDREPDGHSRGDGSFRIEATSSAKYDIAFFRTGYLGAIERGVDLTNEDVDNLQIELPPSGSVRGRIVMPSGVPAKGEQYYVLFPNGRYRAGVVDDDGSFLEEGLPVGHCLVRWVSFKDVRRYMAVVRANDPDEQKRLYKELSQEGGEVFLTDGAIEERTMTLPRRVEVRGTVRIGGVPAMHPSGGFYIQDESGGPGVMVPWDEEGHFVREIEPGKYRVWCSNSQGDWSSEIIEIPDQRSFTFDIVRE